MVNRLDALCSHHDRTVSRLYLLGRPEFELACGAMRTFHHLRDLMRLRLYAARGHPSSNHSATRDAPLAAWPALLRAFKRFERLAQASCL